MKPVDTSRWSTWRGRSVSFLRNGPQCPNESTSRVRRLLALNKKHKWFDRCWREVRECRVPIHELSEGGHGILFVRWLLHQILPYPSFLWAEDWVAARLQISVMALREVISGDSPLARDLLSMRYSGILAGFLGDRWWRGALEDYVWRLTSNRSTEGRSLRIALADRAKMDLDHIDPEATVVGLDANWEPTGSFLSPTNAVSLRPDHWPAFADSAWVDFQTVRNDPRLMALVDPLDSYRFGDLVMTKRSSGQMGGLCFPFAELVREAKAFKVIARQFLDSSTIDMLDVLANQLQAIWSARGGEVQQLELKPLRTNANEGGARAWRSSWTVEHICCPSGNVGGHTSWCHFQEKERKGQPGDDLQRKSFHENRVI